MRVKRSGPGPHAREDLQLVESHRDGGRIRQRVVATLGRRDDTTIGHIVGGFLALRLEVDLQRRLDDRGVDVAWPDPMRDLAEVKAVELARIENESDASGTACEHPLIRRPAGDIRGRVGRRAIFGERQQPPTRLRPAPSRAPERADLPRGGLGVGRIGTDLNQVFPAVGRAGEEIDLVAFGVRT